MSADSAFDNVVIESSRCFLAHLNRRTTSNNRLSDLSVYYAHSGGELSENAFLWLHSAVKRFAISRMFIETSQTKMTPGTCIFAIDILYTWLCTHGSVSLSSHSSYVCVPFVRNSFSSKNNCYKYCAPKWTNLLQGNVTVKNYFKKVCTWVPIIRPSVVQHSVLSDVPRRTRESWWNESRWGTEFCTDSHVLTLNTKGRRPSTDLLLSRHRRDLATKKMKEAQSK
jgi:hypothetical protein